MFGGARLRAETDELHRLLETRRMQTEIGCKAKLEQYLRQQHVGYQLEHDPMAYTARGVAASEHVVAKTVMVMADGESRHGVSSMRRWPTMRRCASRRVRTPTRCMSCTDFVRVTNPTVVHVGLMHEQVQ